MTFQLLLTDERISMEIGIQLSHSWGEKTKRQEKKKKRLHHCFAKPAKPAKNRTNTSNSKHPFLNNTPCLYEYLTNMGHCTHSSFLSNSSQLTATKQSTSHCSELSLNLHNKPMHLTLTELAAPPLLYIPEDRQTTPPLNPFPLDWHACGPWGVHSFLLTLAFVEPQHTASEYRHGRRHGGSVRCGWPMDCGWWPSRRRCREGAGCKVWGVWCCQNGYKWMERRTEMKERWRRLVKDLDGWQNKKGCLRCTGELLVKKGGKGWQDGKGGRCCSWESILSLWSDWLLESEQRQRCTEGRTAAATRRDLSSASSSAVFPYYSQRLNCTQAGIFLLSHSREDRKEKKKALLAWSVPEESV